MPVELGLWRLGKELEKIKPMGMPAEKQLEDILMKNISVASNSWMVIGRQVPTTYGAFIDLLAIDVEGNLIVLELKKDQTTRDVIAQILDYGSWVKTLDTQQVEEIYSAFLEKYHKGTEKKCIFEAMRDSFSINEPPEELNENHSLVVVAAYTDTRTERIVNYLSEDYGIRINILFFNYLKDGEREYISRVWMIDPLEVEEKAVVKKEKRPWNGEYYVNFGEGSARNWEDAVKYGFVAGGHGRWYSQTLRRLEPGNRIWVNIPGQGYVGVGEVTGTVVKAVEFQVDVSGEKKSLNEMPLEAENMFEFSDDDQAEYIVPIRWIDSKTVGEAISETGFFGNQNTVCKPRSGKWEHTVARLRKHFDCEPG